MTLTLVAVCPECGSPMPARRRGRPRVVCSRRCSGRRSGRIYAGANGRHPRAEVTEEVEWLTRSGMGWAEILVHLDMTAPAVVRALQRAGRSDLAGQFYAEEYRLRNHPRQIAAFPTEEGKS